MANADTVGISLKKILVKPDQYNSENIYGFYENLLQNTETLMSY